MRMRTAPGRTFLPGHVEMIGAVVVGAMKAAVSPTRTPRTDLAGPALPAAWSTSG